MTSQLEIDEKSFGTERYLTLMAGLYLNSIYQSREAFEGWLSNGAGQETLPIYRNESQPHWEQVSLENGSKLTLFPFTKGALMYLYSKLEQRTPRLFLQEVLQKHLFLCLQNPIKFPYREHLPHQSHLGRRIPIAQCCRNGNWLKMLKTELKCW